MGEARQGVHLGQVRVPHRAEGDEIRPGLLKGLKVVRVIEAEGLVPGAALPEHVLASLAAVVRAGRKVVVMADSAEAGNRACEAIGQALDARQGSA